MANRIGSLLLILFAVGMHVQLVLVAGGAGWAGWQEFLQLPTESAVDGGGVVMGTKWALLIAGSRYFYNYRHQADVCHAYQIMKKGGLKDENIVVFMYDDIAYNYENPMPGVIINNPTYGTDVYAGVPKDYTGADVTVNNFLAALLGDGSAVTGGSGKVISSGPFDHVFVYYADHGGYGVLGMPSDELLYANDLVDTLQTKHAACGFQSLTVYVEACESGSIFEGLPKDIGVYAVTAANATESSWATYWDPFIGTYLGDLFSVAWMEETDSRDRCAETLEQQYELVRDRTSQNGTYVYGSHVMQYGDMNVSDQQVCQFMGPNNTVVSRAAVKQRDAELVYLWQRYRRSAEGTPQKAEARARLQQVMSRRSQVDRSVELIGGLLFGGEGSDAGRVVLGAVREAGQPLVDDWDCLKSAVRAYERHCGPLGRYGMKHMRAFANICNAGVGDEAVAKAAAQACPAASRAEF